MTIKTIYCRGGIEFSVQLWGCPNGAVSILKVIFREQKKNKYQHEAENLTSKFGTLNEITVNVIHYLLYEPRVKKLMKKFEKGLIRAMLICKEGEDNDQLL